MGEAGGTATLTVLLSAAMASASTVAYATSNGSATAGSDYSATSGTLVFAPDQIGKTISVPLTNNIAQEPSETLTVVAGYRSIWS